MAGRHHEQIVGADGHRYAVVPLGDVLGDVDSASYEMGRLSGMVEVLTWCQTELQLQLDRMALVPFSDTRGVDEFLSRVRDSLRTVQDGSGEPVGLAPSVLGDPETGIPEGDSIPEGEIGG